jgi:hypothetical protein
MRESGFRRESKKFQDVGFELIARVAQECVACFVSYAKGIHAYMGKGSERGRWNKGGRQADLRPGG